MLNIVLDGLKEVDVAHGSSELKQQCNLWHIHLILFLTGCTVMLFMGVFHLQLLVSSLTFGEVSPLLWCIWRNVHDKTSLWSFGWLKNIAGQSVICHSATCISDCPSLGISVFSFYFYSLSPEWPLQTCLSILTVCCPADKDCTQNGRIFSIHCQRITSKLN